MIKPHMPFQDGSKHAANEYCPTCHGNMDPSMWDANGVAIQQQPIKKPAKSVEQILDIWAKQPGAIVSHAERQFIVDMRKAFAARVGYGWMRQVIQWEWDHYEAGSQSSGLEKS